MFAGDGVIGLGHPPEGFEFGIAIAANVFVNWHGFRREEITPRVLACGVID